jgi:hypothetical protein
MGAFYRLKEQSERHKCFASFDFPESRVGPMDASEIEVAGAMNVSDLKPVGINLSTRPESSN